MSTNKYSNHGRYLLKSPPAKSPQYTSLLSTQDQVLNFPFDFQSLPLKPLFSKGTEEFLNCNEPLKNKIGSYLINMIERVCSISFNLMKEEKLTEKMMKNYASKNMLENIKYFCSGLSRRIKEEYVKSKRFHQNQNEYYQTVAYISSKRDSAEYTKIQQGQKRGTQRYLASREKYLRQTPRSNSKVESFVSIERNLHSARSDRLKGSINIEKIIIGVMEYINATLVNIVKQVGLKYLIVPPNNCSKELQEAIQKIDFRQDYGQEFLHKTGQVIKRVPDKNKSEIHDIFTGGIMRFMNSVIELSQGPNDGQTYLTSFKRFNQKLIHTILTQPKEGDLQSSLRYLTQQEQRNQDLLKPQITQKFIANSKIQKNIPKFQASQIQNAQFQNKNSALLRILTKWTQDILQTFEKSDMYIKNNLFKFKDNDNQLIYLNQQQRKILNEQMREAYREMDWHARSQMNTFVSVLLKEDEYEEVRYMYEGSLRLASKLNKYIAKKTVEDLVGLFEVLLSVPERAAKVYEKRAKQAKHTQEEEISKDTRERENRQKQQKLQRQVQELRSVNLICNRLGDLLRSKIFCNESQFIRLLQLLTALNNHTTDHPFFKLIRVKDKLKQSNNNILINYIFKGKIQCQLQICFQSSKENKLTEMSNSMNHFLYELQRGVKGVVAELANIINHNDPLNLLNPSTYVVFKKLPGQSKRKFQQREEEIDHEKYEIWRCCNQYCDEFSVNGSCRFAREKEKYYCYKCYMLRFNKNDSFAFLRKLHYQEKNHWIINFFNTQHVVFQQINESLFQIQEENYKGLYLIIQPTDKKVIVEFALMFYCNRNSTMFIKMLERKTEAKEFTEQMFKESQRMERVVLKVNITRKFICFLESMRKEKGIQVILQKLRPCQINEAFHQAITEINRAFIKKAIINKQANLQIDFRRNITAELQKNANNLSFLQFFQANGLQLTTFQSFRPLPVLKHLFLSHNLLNGKIILKDYPKLSKLKLNNNKIEELILLNVDNLQQLNISNNDLSYLPLDSLQNVKRLELQANFFQDRLALQNLTSLAYLNVNFNDISQLNVSNSPFLEFLYCKKYPNHKSKTVIHLHSSTKLKEIISIQNLIELPNLQDCQLFKHIQKLAIQYQQSMYRYVMAQTFTELMFFAMHYEQLECQSSLISEFLARQPAVNDIELVFVSCKMNELDLRGMKKIQTFTLYSQGSYISSHPILRLDKVERLIIPAELEDLTFDASELKEILIKDAASSMPQSNQLNSNCIERIDITQSNIISDYTFMNFSVLKEIKVKLLRSMNQNPQGSLPKKVICLNNPQLQSIEFISAIDYVSIKECPQVHTVWLKCANKVEIDRVEIQLSNIKELVFALMTIRQLYLKVSSKQLKRIQFTTLVSIAKESDVSFYQKDPQIHLDELMISNSNSSSLRKLLAKVKSAKNVTYNFQAKNEHLSLQTSWLGQKIGMLRMIRQKQKCIESPVIIKLNSEVKVAYLPHRIGQILLYIQVSEMMHVRYEGNKDDIAMLKYIILYRIAKGSAVIIFQVSQDIIQDFRKKIDIQKSSNRLKLQFRRLAESIIDSDL